MKPAALQGGVGEGDNGAAFSCSAACCWRCVRSIAQSVDGTTYWTGGQANISVVAALRNCCVSDCLNTQGAFDVGPAADKRHQPLQEGAIAEYHGIYTMQCSTITLEVAPYVSMICHFNGHLCGFMR